MVLANPDLNDNDLVWVERDAIQQHAIIHNEPHWILNIHLVTRWALSGRRMTFLAWAREQGYNLFFDRFM
jgi:hypothetical protein